MIQIDLPTLVKRLNLFSRQALEMAASECMSQQAAEITVSHVLIQMLAMPRSDLRVITRQGDIGMEELRQALTVENYTTARSADSYPAFSPMLVEWLKEGWLLASAEMQHSELRGGVLLLALLHSPLRYIPPAAARLLTGINRDRLQQDFVQWTQESAESVVPDADGKGAGTMTDASDTLLARYAKNMTADARNGRLDPVLCRDHEIDLMIDILCRRRKNNPVVVGEAGVGKSALIEGLALRIVAGQVPDKLKNTDIMTLDLGALQAGASVKGEFEKRFKGLMAEVISSPVPVILFIDEAHTLIGAGNQQGGLDISNLLKPALARGELKTIAATTWSEYKKYFEKDAALSRRFQLVKVSEPNAAEATIILRGLSAVYEQSHGVLIDDDALQAAATLSERYLSGRQLPDKAIDVLDTACARVAINLSSPPKQISALTTLSHQQEAEIRQLERELRIGLRTDTSRMTEVLVQYDETLTALDELEAAWHQQQTLVREIIALRQQLLGVAEDDAAPLPDADTVEDTQPESESEQDNTGAVGELAKLAQCWQSHNAPELAQATDDLFALYQRAFNRAAPAPVPTPAASGSSPQTTATSESGVTQPSAPAPQIVIDSHDDKAWRDTLLKVAAILCERQPDSPQGYRLRRHALWQNITSTPQAESDGRTPLAAVSADMVADYHAQLGSADMALWQQVEKSVLLAPYWLDGHCLSAQTALRLGYKQVADAIRDEVIRFLERLPQLTGLLFNDHTPFISEQTKQWLAASPDAKVAPVAQIGEESKAARACFAEQGLEAALRYLDMLPEGDPRDQFHRQYLAAQLTEEAGLVQLAQQQYRMLFRMGLQMMVADWEPSLLEQLEQKFTAEQ
ncbi:type VI secretion system protein TssA [Escherichia coli]|nr:type VI secretion system protein TssA [Escherichia coli]HDV3578242.1 type VI secretion system protein TssA [Escherichia coli]